MSSAHDATAHLMNTYGRLPMSVSHGRGVHVFDTAGKSYLDALAGIAVNTWTCDDPVRMAELIEWGIDGICTNVPDVALSVLGREPRPVNPA